MHIDEIETKFLEVDVPAIIGKLEGLGAREDYNGLITARYYDDAERTLKEIGTSLRLRLKLATGDVDWTFKKKKSDEVVRICEELEVPIGPGDVSTGAMHFEHTDLILRQLGLVPYREIQKHRQTFVIDNRRKQVRFEIDKLLSVDGESLDIPKFLEIEAFDRDEVLRYAALLGLDPADAKPWSTRKTIKHYREPEKKNK